jgi:nitroreductase
MKNNVIEKLNWRYATKVFDKSKKLSEDDLNILLESLRLTPSSFGLQPWKFVLVKNIDLREKIKDASYGQTQMTDASDLIVLCAKETITEDDVVKITGNNEGYKNMIMGSIKNKSNDEILNWNAKQVYLALGFLLETAAIMNIDACPMEGFDNKKVDEILGLNEKGLKSVVICPVGYRSEDDKYANNSKFRFPQSELVTIL